MPEIKYQEFIAVERVGPVIVAFSNRPRCEFAFTQDEGVTWVSGHVSRHEDEIITSPWQICSDSLRNLYLGTSKGNIYLGNIAHYGLGWSLVNCTSFADDDPILYIKPMSDDSLFAVSKSGSCISSLDRGLTWRTVEVSKGVGVLESFAKEPDKQRGDK
jgi:hypothetical protein